MTDKKTQLEIGDVIYALTNGVPSYKITVTRVTKTMAMCKRKTDGYEFRFKRDNIHYIRLYGESLWSTVSYQLATPEIDKSYMLEKMRNYIRSMDWKTIPEDTLKQIYTLLKEQKS